MSLSWRDARIAKNESQFRDINEHLEQGLRQVPHSPQLQEFVCECGSRTCEELVELTFEEYEVVRNDSRRFAVVPGHVFDETECVVDGNERYQVVEKEGGAVEMADESDRRAAGAAGRRSADARP